MSPLSEEEKAARIAAAKEKSAQVSLSDSSGGGEDAATRFHKAKTTQKAQSATLSDVGQDAEARLAVQRQAVRKDAEKSAPPIPITRREFLMYTWTASMALLLAGGGISSCYFTLPRFRAGELGGIFSVPIGQFPAEGGTPVPNDEGKYWLVRTEQGYNILYKVCTHLGCLYKWEGTNKRFECPCHGSKFELDGTYIEGPAARDLDRYSVTVRDGSGQVIAESDAAGSPLQIEDPNATVLVDTGERINGPLRG